MLPEISVLPEPFPGKIDYLQVLSDFGRRVADSGSGGDSMDLIEAQLSRPLLAHFTDVPELNYIRKKR